VIESFYYAYRATGDQMYRDWAFAAFTAINDTCRVGSGFAELQNVNAPNGGGFNDFQDSFLFAEVLKYSYLIQAPVSSIPLDC
jgi:mannosyl-oligosaccharide alpha-1,2-mannosidase